jgi:adenosylcobinamide kinase / adenosylcobinamide-phosphate guanylyltransferase
MHFVTGGAFNGKAKWVKDMYGVRREDTGWLNGYESLGWQLDRLTNSLVVIEGLEHFVRQVISEEHSDPREELGAYLKAWKSWEKEDDDRKLVLIGTDIGKGIVPMNKEDRLWRDYTGWFYQDLTMMADRVDVIWYGLSQQLK